MILGILLVFAGMAFVDLPDTIRRQNWREMTVYLLIFIAALVMAILITSGVKIPSALDALNNLFEKVFGKVYPQ